MLTFYKGAEGQVYALQTSEKIANESLEKLSWLFGNADLQTSSSVSGTFVGPRKEMISPWSTNAVEITQNMGVVGIERIELYLPLAVGDNFDPMLQVKYTELGQDLFEVEINPEPIIQVEDIASYNAKEGLALSDEEVVYLEEISTKIGRKLTDAEVFGFSQINSEHCRHKIFNGTFIIDGEEKPVSLFKLIRQTSEENPNNIVSAYKDNVAFVEGSKIEQFAPNSGDKADFYTKKEIDAILSLKAETHNFPTTVEPFNGAATGAGGEIRDRLAGGKGSLPLAGTAVYMTSYSRLEEGRSWEEGTKERDWLYQTPLDILIKASNGASDFGNKFGQPLITGSLLTFEHQEGDLQYGFDKVIMLAGGVGTGKKAEALKDVPEKGDKIVVMGGDNYRIGMGGSSVSSVDTGELSNSIELNAIQRSNPEMQKRVANAIRSMVEQDINPIVSIHDHGAGGHLNCLSELVEETGGKIDLSKLPVGDPTLSAKEIVGNESQERMGLILKAKDVAQMEQISERERAPFYVVGEITEDNRFTFESSKNGDTPMDLALEDMFGNSPKTIMEDKTIVTNYAAINYDESKIEEYVKQVLQIEAVACKDWLTNKVDRCVSGRIAKQQNTGPLHIPLNNVGVVALDYTSRKGIATSIGHSPVSAIIDPTAGSRNSIAEALTNLIWAPLSNDLNSVSLSANWMWPARNEGEDARLYTAVEAISEFAIELGINVPTGKDSMSMTQKYPDGKKVVSPGTVIISAIGECSDVNNVISPVLKKNTQQPLWYVDLSKDSLKIGGSSFAQTMKKLGNEAPTIEDAAYFKTAFNTIQKLIKEKLIVAGHDISSGGLITAALEMCFADNNLGLDLDLSALGNGAIEALFAENSGLLIQVQDADKAAAILNEAGIDFKAIGTIREDDKMNLTVAGKEYNWSIADMRDTWYRSSYLLDRNQSGAAKAKERFENYKNHELNFKFPANFTGQFAQWGLDRHRTISTGLKAAVIREKGSNSEREMAHALHLAGFDVKDIHMTDLMSGKEDLTDVHFIAAVGGFSNSDVLGSAKGWAGVFKYNENAKRALENFMQREDTLSLGVCNGCQLFMELGMVYPEMGENHPTMHHNDSHKFESGFVSVDIPENNSVMFKSLAGTKLGAWVANGEGKFILPGDKSQYDVAGTYTYDSYPANPNGSDYNTMAMTSKDGRVLVMMPHLERSILTWNWAHYPDNRQADEVTPWIEAFVNAKEWILSKQ